jgi:hypothetical protein
MMRIEYVASKSQRTVSDGIGKALIDRKLARRVYETRQVEAKEPAAEAEISERTGKPKRRYKRRDMTAEG